MPKDKVCTNKKVHFPTRRFANNIMEKKLKEKELKPGSLHVFRCPECHKFIIGNLRGKEYQILVLPTREKRIRDLLAKPERNQSENGTLGSLIADWAIERKLPLPPKRVNPSRPNQKGRGLDHLIELWNSENRK
jgi:hypothetical protein